MGQNTDERSGLIIQPVRIVSAETKASDNTLLSIADLPQTYAYNTDGTLNYIQVVAPSGTYRQTFTYVAGKVTGISIWTKQ